MPDRLGPIDYVRQQAAEREQPAATCPGFPTECSNVKTVTPDPPTHFGGIRCGCADQAATERHTVDTITSDALDALYEQLDAAQDTELARQLATCDKAFASATVRAAEAEQRAAQAEALARVAHETSNRSETERARAVERAEQAEAAIERVEAATHDLRHKDAMRILAAIDEPKEK
ncbi:hypothetical protein [Streptomyces wuyuanensis]|uniref:hypothetical protein n=1 Tax=Streptomyces wuyuanensis TaxID=1196353 RepID=UPI0037AA993A